MKGQDFYYNIIRPVFEEKLKGYFENILGKNVSITFLTFDVDGFVWFGDIDKYNSIGKFISFFFLNDEFKYCDEYDDVCYVKFIPHSTFKNYLRRIEGFEEKNEFIFNLKHLKKSNADYLKKEFLRAFNCMFCLTVNYLNYEKMS